MQGEYVQVTGVVIEDQGGLTLAEVCRACAVHAESIVELVEEGVLEPAGRKLPEWRFSGVEIRRARTALRLRRDLGVNLAGVALAMQLLEELEALRAQVNRRDSGSL